MIGIGVLVALYLAGSTSAAATAADRVIKRLNRLQAKSPIIDLDADLFDELFYDGPRPFDGLLLVNVKEPSCAACQKVDELYDTFANKVVAHENSLAIEGRPFYFFHTDAMKDQLVPQALQMTTVPRLLRLTANNVECKDNGDLCSDIPNDFIQVAMLLKQSPSKLLSNALGRPDWVDQIFEKPILRKRQIIMLGAASLVSLVVGLPWIRAALVRWPPLVAVGALVAFWLSTSGLVFSWQHRGTTTFFPRDRSGRIYEFFSAKTRNQYTGEGLLFSGLTIMFGLSILCAMGLPAMIRPKGSFRAYMTKIACVVALVLAVVLFLAIERVLRIKETYIYGSFFPDASFHRGGPRVDRMYSI